MKTTKQVKVLYNSTPQFDLTVPLDADLLAVARNAATNMNVRAKAIDVGDGLVNIRTF